LEHNITRYSSIAEYGCGNGSNLYYFAKKHKSIVYGCDISEYLIDVCKVVLPEYKNNFFAANKFLIPDLSVDVCMSNSVFQYFPSYDYATIVITEMLRVAKNNIIITDIKDIRYADQFKENQARRKNISMVELKKLYKNTPLLFYSRDFFLQFGDVMIIDMPSSYADSEFNSFSVMINKSVR
jgi:ubiquinone/menaquinone biosynthesis C-methylase UbiE